MAIISKSADMIAKILRSVNSKKILSEMMLHPKRNTKYKTPPKRLTKKYNTQISSIQDHACYSFNTDNTASKHILYFHGGAYTLEAKKLHWRIIENLLINTECKVTMVDYPLAPEADCSQTIEMSLEAYKHFCEDSRQEIILMGDSAGGGLALSLAQRIKNGSELPMSKKLILFSPWIDVSMSDPISNELAEKDVILGVDTLKIIGEMYAGNLNTQHPYCSPLYGDLKNLCPIDLFIGTSDILFAQAERLKEKAMNEDVGFNYHVYKDMLHDWIGYPIPEAKEAMAVIYDLIEN